MCHQKRIESRNFADICRAARSDQEKYPKANGCPVGKIRNHWLFTIYARGMVTTLAITTHFVNSLESITAIPEIEASSTFRMPISLVPGFFSQLLFIEKKGYKLVSAVDTQLLIESVEMVFHSMMCNAQLTGDLLVASSLEY